MRSSPAWTAGWDKQALFDALIARHVPCAPVRNLAEVVNDPHMHARGALERIEHPELGRDHRAAQPAAVRGLQLP